MSLQKSKQKRVHIANLWENSTILKSSIKFQMKYS